MGRQYVSVKLDEPHNMSTGQVQEKQKQPWMTNCQGKLVPCLGLPARLVEDIKLRCDCICSVRRLLLGSQQLLLETGLSYSAVSTKALQLQQHCLPNRTLVVSVSPLGQKTSIPRSTAGQRSTSAQLIGSLVHKPCGACLCPKLVRQQPKAQKDY